MKPFKLRVQVRKTVYHDQPGFLVLSNKGIFGQQIFVRSKEKAEIVREKIKTGQEITKEDLQ